MKLILILLFNTIFFLVNSQIDQREDFLNWLIKNEDIKHLDQKKLDFNDTDFAIVPETFKYSEREAFYPDAICYYIEADSNECNTLKNQYLHKFKNWTNMDPKSCKIISENLSIKHHHLSEPLFFQDKAVVKVKYWDKVGYLYSIRLYEKNNGKWNFVKIIYSKAS